MTHKSETVSSMADEIATVEALLDGSCEAPTEDLTEPASALAHEEEVMVKADDIPEMSEHDLVEALTATAPDRTERRARSEAFKDRVAQERAQEILGDDFEEIVQAMDTAPKKVGEKVYNALCFIAGRGKLSNYTVMALEALREEKTLSSADMLKLYMKEYVDTTARSQAQQMMTALPILKLAQRDGDKLVFIDGKMDAIILARQLEGPSEAPAPRKKSKPAPDVVADEEALLADDAEDDTELAVEEEAELLAASEDLMAVEEIEVPDVLDHEAGEDADLLASD